MTNKIELEFEDLNYEGSKIFSSLADVLGLSVDLVSFVRRRRSFSCQKRYKVEMESSSHPNIKNSFPAILHEKRKFCPHSDASWGEMNCADTREENKQKDDAKSSCRIKAQMRLGFHCQSATNLCQLLERLLR